MTTQASARQRKWHRRPEAAEYIRQNYNQPCAATTLATWATIGGGPPFSKAGNTALYAEDDLDAWALERMGQPRRSTSELRQPEPTRAPAAAGADQSEHV